MNYLNQCGITTFLGREVFMSLKQFQDAELLGMLNLFIYDILGKSCERGSMKYCHLEIYLFLQHKGRE
jgi:hypothetical protein